MGGGIGKMFGIDKIFGGILDSVGLGALKPLVSTAFDFATGNIPGLLQDLTGLMSSFGDGGFANNIAKNQPFSPAFNPSSTDSSYDSPTADQADQPSNATPASNNNNNDLSSSRISQLFKLLEGILNSKDPADTAGKLSQLFKLLSDTAQNQQTVQNARTSVQFFSGGVTINA
jgi:hypothetical protein